MENLSPESRALYEILKADTQEAYDQRFLDHKKEILDAVRIYVNDTGKQFQNIADVHADVGAELAEVKSSIGAELAGVWDLIEIPDQEA